MALWRLYYHIVWATKEREQSITAELERPLYGYILGKATALECVVHAIGGMGDHVHLVLSAPPKLSIAELVQNLKGSSAHYANSRPSAPDMRFAWQRGYGVFSLGSRQLDAAVEYVRGHKAHHGQGDAVVLLERDSDVDDGPANWRGGEALAGISPVHETLPDA